MRVRRPASLTAAAAVALTCLATPALARADTAALPGDPLCTDVSSHISLRIGSFGLSPMQLVALDQGFFAKENLDVTFDNVAGSTYQFAELETGSANPFDPTPYGGTPGSTNATGTDLVFTAMDNVVNYRLNASNALHHTLPVQAVAATDGGYNLQLFGQKGLASPRDVTTLGVDATNSGFAFIAYDILTRYGFAPPTKTADGSYTSTQYGIQAIGGTGNRYRVLTGETANTTPPVDATLLNSGFDVAGALQGYPGFEDVRSVTSPYLSGVVAGLQPWLASHRCAVVRFDRALSAATRYTVDPANEAVVESDIAAAEPGPIRQNGVDPAAYAAGEYRVTADPVIGQYHHLEFDPKGLYDVLALRKKYDGFDQPQSLALLSTPFGGLYTDSYVLTADATALLRH